MGIDHFIRRTEVREKFLNEFRKPDVSRKKEFLAPPITNRPQKLGKAFDYLMRFKIKRLNPQSVESRWTAERIVDEIIEMTQNLEVSNPRMQELFQRLEDIIYKAKEAYSTFLESSELEIKDELVDSALFLAKIDQMGYINPETGIPESLWVLPDEDKKDLRNLISVVDPEQFKTTDVSILSPSFGEIPVFKMASGDLIIGDALIDIKTINHSKFDRRYFNELMCYYTLYRIGGINGFPAEKKINKVGVYFSRYGYLALIDLENVVNEDTFPEFVEWFIEEAEK